MQLETPETVAVTLLVVLLSGFGLSASDGVPEHAVGIVVVGVIVDVLVVLLVTRIVVVGAEVVIVVEVVVLEVAVFDIVSIAFVLLRLFRHA